MQFPPAHKVKETAPKVSLSCGRLLKFCLCNTRWSCIISLGSSSGYNIPHIITQSNDILFAEGLHEAIHAITDDLKHDNAWVNCSFKLSTLRSYNISGASLSPMGILLCFTVQREIGLTGASLPKDDSNNHLLKQIMENQRLTGWYNPVAVADEKELEIDVNQGVTKDVSYSNVILSAFSWQDSENVVLRVKESHTLQKLSKLRFFLL